MADKILVSTPEMQATVARYQQSQNTLADAQKSMSAALRNLDHCWKGPAWAAMMAKWAEIEANIQKAHLSINRSIRALGNAITSYEEGEESNKSTGSALSTGTASKIYVE